MEQKDSKIFNKETLGSVESFCKLNNIEDKEDFIYLCFSSSVPFLVLHCFFPTSLPGEKVTKVELV